MQVKYCGNHSCLSKESCGLIMTNLPTEISIEEMVEGDIRVDFYGKLNNIKCDNYIPFNG